MWKAPPVADDQGDMQKQESNTERFLDECVQRFIGQLDDNFVGLYVHGSLALNCFQPSRSDIDLLMILDRKLHVDERRELTQLFVALSDRAPAKGSLEISAVLKSNAVRPQHPSPFEVHYSEYHRNDVLNDLIDSRNDGFDFDLTTHFASVRERERTLYGPSAKMLFGAVNWENFIDSCVRDFKWMFEPERFRDNPVYGILNACRTLTILQAHKILILSKIEGAELALTNFPKQFHGVVQYAMNEYIRNPEMATQTIGNEVFPRAMDATKLAAFRDFAITQFEAQE
jgi:streptomycin 3"-adenylyltransferase